MPLSLSRLFSVHCLKLETPNILDILFTTYWKCFAKSWTLCLQDTDGSMYAHCAKIKHLTNKTRDNRR